MVALHHFSELGSIDVGVDLRGADVGVAEEVLHDAKVRAADQEMGREAVAELVRVDVIRRPATAAYLRTICQTATRSSGRPLKESSRWAAVAAVVEAEQVGPDLGRGTSGST